MTFAQIDALRQAMRSLDAYEIDTAPLGELDGAVYFRMTRDDEDTPCCTGIVTRSGVITTDLMEAA